VRPTTQQRPRGHDTARPAPADASHLGGHRDRTAAAPIVVASSFAAARPHAASAPIGRGRARARGDLSARGHRHSRGVDRHAARHRAV